LPSITITKPFKRKLKKKTPDQVAAIIECLDHLGENPRQPGLHTHRIQGTRRTWEAYVDGSNRVSWEWGDGEGEIVVLNHCSHQDVLGK